MTKDERARLVQDAAENRRARFAPLRATTPSTSQQRWKRGFAVQPRQPHELSGKPRKFSVYWIATDGAMDRHVNGDMCELAAEKVAGALRDLMSDDECGRGTYLHGTSTDNAVAQAGWVPADDA